MRDFIFFFFFSQFYDIIFYNHKSSNKKQNERRFKKWYQFDFNHFFLFVYYLYYQNRKRKVKEISFHRCEEGGDYSDQIFVDLIGCIVFVVNMETSVKSCDTQSFFFWKEFVCLNTPN